MKSKSFLNENTDRYYEIIAERKFLKSELKQINEDIRQLDEILPVIGAIGGALARGAIGLGGTALRGLGSAALKGVGALGRGVAAAAPAIGGIARGAGSVVGGGLAGAGALAGGALSGAGRAIGGAAQGVGSAVGGIAQGVGSAVGGIAQGLGNAGGRSGTAGAGRFSGPTATTQQQVQQAQQMKKDLSNRKQEVEAQIKALQQELQALSRGV